MNSSQGFIRRPKTFFTQVSNHIIDDKDISPQSYYIYSKIQRYITLETEEFMISKSFIYEKSYMKEKTFEKYWKELMHKGYLKMYQFPPKKGTKNWTTEFELLQEKDLETPYFTQFDSKGNIKKIIMCPTQKGGCTKKVSAPPKKRGAQKERGTKMGGLYNNTYVFNTNNKVVCNDKNISDTNTCESVSLIIDEYKAITGSRPNKNTVEEIKKFAAIMEPSLILRAVGMATDKGKKWGYAKGILNNSLERGITTYYDFVMQ